MAKPIEKTPSLNTEGLVHFLGVLEKEPRNISIEEREMRENRRNLLHQQFIKKK